MSNAKTTPALSATARSEDLKQMQLAYLSALELSQFKTGFLARTSHELRSPLNGLISSLQLILADLCDDAAEERDYVKIAHDSALKLVEILDQVITVSKIAHGTQSLKIEAVDLDLVLQEVAMMVRMQAENRNLKLNIPLLDAEINVRADMASLRQILVMLVDGAIVLMQQGVISVAAIAESGWAKIQIVDDRPEESWREIIAPAELSPLTAGVSSADLKKSADSLSQLPTLSTNFRLMLAKELLMSMGGNLELVEVDGKNQIQCWVPLAAI